MEQSTFKFRVREIEVGGCDVVMTINDKVIPYNATYMGIEPMASMIEICAEMVLRTRIPDVYRMVWTAEPGALRFTFSPNDNGMLHIDIVDEMSEEEWHEDVPFESFVSSIVSEGFRVLKAFGLYGYRSAWADDTDFPVSQLLLISGLYKWENIDCCDCTSDVVEEAECLKRHTQNDSYDSERHLDECTVYYDSWQLQCCGEPFSVGDKVTWTCDAPGRPTTAHGTIIDFHEEHHHGYTHRITGVVTKIEKEMSDTPKKEKVTHYNKVLTFKRKTQCADGIGEESDKKTERRTLWGYIVELEDVTVKPLNGEKVVAKKTLTKEDLQKIKMPLSDDDYVRLREEELRTDGEVWKLASEELRDAYEDAMLWWWGKHMPPGTDAEIDDIIWLGMWYPPKTEKYRDYPNYHKTGGIRKRRF